MTWAAYELVYRTMSPLHVGWHTLGYIKLTRHYIPGKAIWGAFTANLVRSGQHNLRHEDYERVGKIFREDVLVSYFYPAIDAGDGLQAIRPKYTDQGLMYGEYGKEKFERLFIASFGQTAVVPESNTAEDKSLHESEFIKPTVEVNGAAIPVYFTGYLFLKDGASLGDDRIDVGWEGAEISLKEPLSEIFIGGDRKYGWGRLSLDSDKTKTEVKKMFDIPLIPDKDSPKLKIPAGHAIPAHIPITQGIKIKGDIEPLVGRDWGEVENKEKEKIVGFGQEINPSGICWMPGSVLSEQKTFNIGAYGILKSGE